MQALGITNAVAVVAGYAHSRALTGQSSTFRSCKLDHAPAQNIWSLLRAPPSLGASAREGSLQRVRINSIHLNSTRIRPPHTIWRQSPHLVFQREGSDMTRLLLI